MVSSTIWGENHLLPRHSQWRRPTIQGGWWGLNSSMTWRTKNFPPCYLLLDDCSKWHVLPLVFMKRFCQHWMHWPTSSAAGGLRPWDTQRGLCPLHLRWGPAPWLPLTPSTNSCIRHWLETSFFENFWLRHWFHQLYCGRYISWNPHSRI